MAITWTSLIATVSAPVRGQLTVGPASVPAAAKLLGMQWDVTNQVTGNSAMSGTLQISLDGGTTWKTIVQAEREIFAAPTSGVAQFWTSIAGVNSGSLMARGILTIANAIVTITTSAELMWS